MTSNAKWFLMCASALLAIGGTALGVYAAWTMLGSGP